MREIVLRQFRGAMAFDRQRQFRRHHAEAVINDRDQRLTTFPESDVDARRIGIDRILDQLLDRRCRALDDLARGDAVDQDGGQQADRHGITLGHRASGDEGKTAAGSRYRRDADLTDQASCLWSSNR